MQIPKADRPAARWRSLWWPALVAVLPALAVAVVELQHLGQRAVPSGDFALLANDVDRALHLSLSVGPYSRFGWHHPGPLLSYWLAPFWWASGHRYGGLGLGAAVLTAVILAAIVVAVGRSIGRTAAWVTAALAIGFSLSYGLDRLREPWNPAAAILPLAGVAVLGAAMAAGRRWFLPLWIAFATLALQAHVGSAPVLAAVVLGPLVVGIIRNRRLLARWVPPVLVGLAVLLALWAPPLIQERYPPKGQDGNLTRIYDYVGDGPPPQQTWETVEGPLEVLAPVTVPRFGSLLGGPPAGTLEPSTIDWVVLGLLAAGLVATLVVGIVDRSAFRIALAVAGILAVPASILAAFRVQGALYPYLAFYAVSAGIVAWVATGTTLAWLVGRTWRAATARIAARRAEKPQPRHRPKKAGPRHRAAPAWRHVVVPVAITIVAVGVAAGSRDVVSSATLRNSPASAQLGAEARTALAKRKVKRVLVDMNQLQWITGAGVVRDLEDHGYTVTVAKPWRSTFGEGSRATGREQVRLVVTPAGSRYPADEDDRLLATRQGRSIWIGEP